MSAPQTTAPERREGFQLGRIAGIPIILANSWFVIAAFTVIVFGPQLESGFTGIGWWAYVVAFIYALLLLFSVLIHELFHALAAKVYHWPTQKIVLNLWGGHTQFENFTATPGRALVVAFAGPLANIALAGLAWLFLPFLGHPATLAAAVVNTLVNIFIWANFLIGAFNVLPGLPLDGGRLVESIVWKLTGSQDKGTVAAGWAGRVVVAGIVAVGLGWPLLRGEQPNLTTAVVTLFLAGFLWLGASQSITGAQMRLRLPAITAAALAHPAVGAPELASVAQLWGLRSANPAAAIVLFGPEGRPVAVVDETVLAQVPAAVAGHTPASSVGRALVAGAYVPEAAAGAELVQYLAQLHGTEYAVIDPRGQVTGLLHQSEVVAAITGKLSPRTQG